MQIKDQSIASHRKRTTDNLVWIVIIFAILGAMAFSACAEQKNSCKLTRGFVGYGNR
jgi:hypothetical protein